MTPEAYIADLMRRKGPGRVAVAIAGMTCSGKTTLADRIAAAFAAEGAALMRQDDYYKDLPDIPRGGCGFQLESPAAFHTAEFVRDAKTLLSTGAVLSPVYDVASNTRRTEKRLVRAGRIAVFEGLHAVSLLKGEIDCVAFFADEPPEVCLARRVRRDTAAFGVPEEAVRAAWERRILPESRAFVLPQRDAADLLVTDGGETVGTA